MSHCKDCEFFANNFEVDKLTRKVQKVLDDSDTGFCFNAFVASDLIDDWLKRYQSKEQLRVGIHASCNDCRGDLTVGKDFGCIHFEQRATQKDDMESTTTKRQCFTCPKQTSVWAWGDPSHTRIVTPEQMTFLSQQEYINYYMSNINQWERISKELYDMLIKHELERVK